MKKSTYFVMLAAMGAAGMAQAEEPEWSYSLPESGLLPSAASYEFASSMRERHGGDSHFGMQSASLTIPFSDPRKSSFHGWAFNAEFTTTLSFVDAEGTLDLESDTLCKVALPLSFIRRSESGSRWVLAVSPTMASDMERAARSFDVGFFAAYTKKVDDNFSFSFGLAAYPNFTRYGVLPLFGFEWKPTEDWTLKLKGYRFTAMKALSERLSLGAFAAAEGGTWAVQTRRGSRALSVHGLVLGVTGEYDFSQPGQRKRLITASLGSQVATSVRFHEFNDDFEADETHHYRPGLYASVGVDFRF